MRNGGGAVERRTARRAARSARLERRALLEERLPYLASVRGPRAPGPGAGPNGVLEVATYNVHRFTGTTGRRRWDPGLAAEVIAELGSDVIALQEVVRPFDAEDPLERIADELGAYLAFVSTRIHKRGEVGNAILSRWPPTAAFTINLSFGRLERRSAVAMQFHGDSRPVAVASTHLALVDRTREQQVRSLLGHPQLQGPGVLLGDMNAWRACRATRQLDQELTTLHHNRAWPPTFPSARPVLALDRVYARGARVLEVRAHRSAAARRGSDHLPLIATVQLNGSE